MKRLQFHRDLHTPGQVERHREATEYKNKVIVKASLKPSLTLSDISPAFSLNRYALSLQL